jgi:hypothetical protein
MDIIRALKQKESKLQRQVQFAREDHDIFTAEALSVRLAGGLRLRA